MKAVISAVKQADQADFFHCCQQVLNIDQRYGNRRIFEKRLLQAFDPQYSAKLCYKNQIIGGYILNAHNTVLREFNLTPRKIARIRASLHQRSEKEQHRLRLLFNTIDLYSGRGIQGHALFLRSEFRNRGWGKRLIQYPYTLYPHFQYIWGGQEKNLFNLYDWLKRRTLFYDDHTCFLK